MVLLRIGAVCTCGKPETQTPRYAAAPDVATHGTPWTAAYRNRCSDNPHAHEQTRRDSEGRAPPTTDQKVWGSNPYGRATPVRGDLCWCLRK